MGRPGVMHRAFFFDFGLPCLLSVRATKLRYCPFGHAQEVLGSEACA